MLRKHIDRIVRFPVTTIILAIFATAFFAYQFKGLHMVLDPKALLPQDHPYVKLNNEIEKQFGGSRVVLIGVASKDGDIFNPSDIEKIRRINEDVKGIPGILENNVVSIADRKVKYVKAEGDSLEIKGLLEGIEYTPEGMAELRNRIYSNPMFINSLVSEDGTVAAIITDFKGGAGDWWQKAEVRSKKNVVRSKKNVVRSKKNVVAQFIGQDQQPDKSGNYNYFSAIMPPAGGGKKGGGDLIPSAWAQEDWKKWQNKRGATEDVPSSSPSPQGGEGRGEGERPAQGQVEGKWPSGREGGWPGADDGDKGWEQWYVSDSTIHNKILNIVNKYKDANTEIYVGGLPIALSFLEADSWRMIRYVYPLAIIVIMVLHYFAFRSVQGVVLPIVCSLLSVVWGVGLMGVFNIPLDPWNMMTPILILAVAGGHSVQILKRYYEELDVAAGFSPRDVVAQFIGQNQGPDKSGNYESAPSEMMDTPSNLSSEGRWSRDISKQAVVESLTKIGPVMITAGLVAAASFASLITFKLKTFQSFGIFTAFGILSALVIEMTFIPAARSLMRPPKIKKSEVTPTPALSHRGGGYGRGGGGGTPSPHGAISGEGKGGGASGDILDRFLLAVSRLISQRIWLIWIGLVVVIAFSLYGINRLTIINSLKGLFFESTQFRKDDAALNRYFGGTATFYVYVEGTEPDSLKDPAVLHAIEALQKEMEAVPEVGKTQSYVDYVKAFNQSMHGGDITYRTIPDNRSTISEYLFLFSLQGSQGEMSRFLDYQYQKSVIWVFLRDDSTVLGEKLINIVKKYSGGAGFSSVKGEPTPTPSLPPQGGGGKGGEVVPSPPVGEGGVVARFIGQRPDKSGNYNSQGSADLHFPPGIKVGVAGSIPVMMALNQTMVSGKLWNIIQIGAIVFVISSIVMRSPLGGILVLLPLAIAVLVNFGVLGIVGIGLGVGTAAISAMVVGFGADYSIYLLYRLREEVGGGDKRSAMDAAIKQTLLTAGKAIIFVASALAAGGFTLLFTGYYLHMEGFLVPLAMVTSSLATLIVLPAIVTLIRPRFIFK